MQIYPAIDIKNGQCVRLKQGRFDDLTVFGDDPVKVASQWVESGATFLHIVDLDGARAGTSYNKQVIEEIAAKFAVPVQVGGGIRTMRDIEDMLSIGVSRVILGTAAVKEPDMVAEAVKVYGRKIAVGIDAMNGRVAVSGWEEISSVSALDLCIKMRDAGVKTIIYTDISKDGMMIGPNVLATKKIVESTGIDIIASGGVANMADLESLEAIDVHGAIIGKALYLGAIHLKEVINRFEKKPMRKG